MKTITIIGAGAAGLMAATTILESSSFCHPEGTKDLLGNKEQIPRASQGQNIDFHIQIFEKNTSPGKKVIISGGGRCNVTTGIKDKKILLSKYTRGADFIRKAFGKFSPRKCREWFESHGVPMKCESDNRVFPVSDDGTEVVEAFTRIFAKYRDKVTLHYGEGVSGVSVMPTASVIPGLTRDTGNNNESSSAGFLSSQEGQKTGLLHPKGISNASQRGTTSQGREQKYQITTAKGVYESDIVVVTTGGNAYSHTGSTGDGYAFARSLGHTVTQLGPSLSSWLTREQWTHELSGLAFERARIEKLEGPILLTHFGLSGPLAFMYSSQVAWETIDKSNPKTIYLSPLADMGVIEWDSFLKLEFANHPKKLITNILSEKLPHRFAELFVGEYCPHIETTYPVSIARVDREHIARLLGDGIPLTLTDRRPGDEFVTAGGVDTDEIDPETMESRISKNLYFAGEVLNVDGYTGGFSLQICWASGYVVGRDIATRVSS